eukprot:TRINITY_DN47362_c0_g1_i1.p1 TRINITY_DN47362_c0_g1~~TRINITY_DN47362_c0_g1_i1.p1  ORF type:complete len:971 (+),score=548.72 TRINITY_DN47362_c0_g1_i1:368-2914(+)
MAVGLDNGAVVLYHGDLMRGRGVRTKMLEEAGGPAVTSLHFRDVPNEPVNLFVTTTKTVLSFFTKMGGKEVPRVVLDPDGGCAVNCAVLNDKQQLVVGRDEAVFFYDADDKGICFGFEGVKKRVGWFNTYLYVVSDSNKGNGSGSQLTLYDLKNKFVAYNGSQFGQILNMVSEWGSLFVITRSAFGPKQVPMNLAYQLSEKDLRTKMNLLFRTNLYNIAISLAHAQDCDQAYIQEIFLTYGDHLYDKGDFDGAIQQYLETIGSVQPSYVIRKFLDAQRIHNLTRYLQALHEKGQANADHTTLLLNCYTKLKDVAKLDEFVKTDSGLQFDTKTAIRVCRQAGYYEHAMYLAKRHGEDKLYLKILIDDVERYEEAIVHIASLEFAKASFFMREYGKKLMEQLDDDTTQLLSLLCTAYRPTTNTAAASSSDTGSTAAGGGGSNSGKLPAANAEDFIHLFVGRPWHLREFLRAVVDSGTDSQIINNTLLELYLQWEDNSDGNHNDEHDDHHDSGRHGRSAAASSTTTASQAATAAAAAAGALVGSDRHRVRRVRRAKRGRSQIHPNQDQIMQLLLNSKSYDVDHALVLCKQYGFEKGVLYLLTQLKLYNEIIRYHMEQDNYDQIIANCNKYGQHDSQLWVQALEYFAQKQENECERHIVQVLERIESNNLLPPLMVVKTLAKNRRKPLAVIKQYIIKTLQDETEVINNDDQVVRQYQEETAQMRAQIDELLHSPTTFQGQKCQLCSSPLELPAVHFLCLHSFHLRCLGDNDTECPMCSAQYHKIMDLKRQMKASAAEPTKFFDQFSKELESSLDGFNTVAKYFGQGLFPSEQDDIGIAPPSSSSSASASNLL